MWPGTEQSQGWWPAGDIYEQLMRHCGRLVHSQKGHGEQGHMNAHREKDVSAPNHIVPVNEHR